MEKGLGAPSTSRGLGVRASGAVHAHVPIDSHRRSVFRLKSKAKARVDEACTDFVLLMMHRPCDDVFPVQGPCSAR